MDLEDLVTKENISGIGALVAAIPVSILAFKKFFIQSKMADTQITANEANTEVINMLRDEISRIDKMYQEALARINQVHSENLELRKENFDLRNEISKLNHKIEEMQGEIEGIGRRKSDH